MNSVTKLKSVVSSRGSIKRGSANNNESFVDALQTPSVIASMSGGSSVINPVKIRKFQSECPSPANNKRSASILKTNIN